MATKILAPSYWIHTIDQQSSSKVDLLAYKLSAWTSDPRAIPKVVWLHIANNEVIHVVVPLFSNLLPYIRQKNVLGYCVFIHLRNVTNFDPSDPSPSPSPLVSDDGDSGHDSNPDHHHFSRGTGPCIQGFQCFRGLVNGELASANGYGAGAVEQQTSPVIALSSSCQKK
jgi:hypothetical protein